MSGVISFELVTGKLPFRGDTRVALFTEIKQKPLRFDPKKRLSRSCASFVLKGLLNRNPLLRLKAATAFEHKWLKHCERSASDDMALEVIKNPVDYFDCSPLKQIVISMCLCEIEHDFSEMISIIFDEIDLDFDGLITKLDVESYLKKHDDDMELEEDVSRIAAVFIAVCVRKNG